MDSVNLNNDDDPELLDLDQSELDTRNKLANAALVNCKELAYAPSILQEVEQELKEGGLIGESHASKAIFLALVTRLTNHPVPLIIKGASSGGKSNVVKKVLCLFREKEIENKKEVYKDYVSVTSLSEQSLFYFPDSLSHKYLIVFEWIHKKDSTIEDTIRTLISEKKLIRFTVEKSTEKSTRGKNVGVIKITPGPTGLITTSTHNLNPENENRMFAIYIDDTPQQTRRILTGDKDEEEDTTYRTIPPQWHAYQKWLELGETRVVIPFKKTLGGMLPDKYLRMRRDFPNIKSLIRAHTMMHRLTRQSDPQGRIIATIEDYANVYDIINPSLSRMLGTTVPPEIREVIATVAKLVPGEDSSAGLSTSIDAIAAELKLEEHIIYRRVKEAIKLGYLNDLRRYRGRGTKMQIALSGSDIPNDISIMPTPEALEAQWKAEGGY